MNHTPTPWGTKSRSGWDTGNAAVWSGPTLVAQCGRQGTPEQLANAAFIVRACNAHEALVEALERLMRYESEDRPELWDSYLQATSALKLARGE